MLALHLLQSALVHVNTLLMQRVLEAPALRTTSVRTTAAACPRRSGPTSTPTATRARVHR